MRRIDRRMRNRLVRPVRPLRRHIVYVEPRPRIYRGRSNVVLYSILIVFLLVFFISFLIMCFYLF